MACSHYSKIYWVSLPKQNINPTDGSHRRPLEKQFPKCLSFPCPSYCSVPGCSFGSFPKYKVFSFFAISLENTTFMIGAISKCYINSSFPSKQEWKGKWWEALKPAATFPANCRIQSRWEACNNGVGRDTVQDGSSFSTAGILED